MRIDFNKNNMVCNKLSKVLSLAAVCILLSFKPAFSQEITAIDFNGDLIGKVIPDGKVVSFDNQLIGNINADSLIVNFDGDLIGGIVPQGIAIGNDNKPLGKVNNDGSVRVPSGKIIGKTLPNGLVVDEFYEVIGFVLFPGLIYSDDGKTVGRLTGDGSYTNLQGQKIGFISTDGYAYRKVGNDDVLDGRLISSKMVISNNGEFIGSVSPGGDVTDFDAKAIGKIKANGFAYDQEGKVIGHIVSAGYAFDNYGKYLGFVNYNGEVVHREQLIGRINSTGDVIDLSGKVIGYSVDFATTYTDLSGKYLGRLIPEGKVVKAKEEIGVAAPRGLVVKGGNVIGLSSEAGPIFDYRGILTAHAQRNGSVVLFEGTTIGGMKGKYAYNKSGAIIGSVEQGRLALDLNNNVLGIVDTSASIGSGEDKAKVSPFGYIFSPEGKISGYSIDTGTLYLDGVGIAEVSPNGEIVNKGSVLNGKITSVGVHINDENRVLGQTLQSDFITLNNSKDTAYLSNTNVVFTGSKDIIGKALSDGTIVSTSKEDTKNLMPKIGQSYEGNIVLGTNGNFIGYAGINGIVRDSANSIVGQVIGRGLVLDNNGSYLGEIVPYSVAVSSDCEFLGVITPRGDVRNAKDIFVGRTLLNGQIISDSGSNVGHYVKRSVVVDNSGNFFGITSPDGKVLNYSGENLGCVSNKGILKNSDGVTIAYQATNNPVINFNGSIVGRSSLTGSLINNDGNSTGYVQSNDNANTGSGVPLGNVFKYKFAFDNGNKFIGVILEDGSVLGSGGKNLGTVDFYGYVNSQGERSGYALYDLYVYDNAGIVVGYIARDGNVLSLSGQNIGKIDRGFVIDRTGKVSSRGNRDFYIRNETNSVIGELTLVGDLVDANGKTIGKINPDNGIISDANGETVGRANALQYYGKAIGVKPVYDEGGRVIGYAGDDGSVVNEDGKIIALLNENGLAVSANGDIIGGIGTDWYERAPKVTKRNDRDIEIGIIDPNVQERAKRSFAVALTPDGEYLGRILDDGRVVDDAGNVLGVRLGDGLIIDDQGGLIGIEESVQADFGGNIFVPSGTFGPGAAYGIGAGAGGNLGPGGGYGPGERYDPQRAAALAAAQEERRKNINVGKISTNVKISSFTGTQPNWDEQGVGKTLSSWRVDLSEMILADKPIPAVIARSIDSSNPTPVTAIVERNVYAEEGRNIIIPAGSRVIGVLGSLTGTGEATTSSAKVQINWERLIRPDGSIFVFQGITGDAQGRGGALGYLDQQLIKKYTFPVVTTMLTSAAAYLMAPNSNASGETETPKQQAANDARQNFLDKMTEIFNQVLADKMDIKPLTYVPAGTRIIIYPNVDLWLRTAERDELEGAANMSKKDIFIDDKETVADQQAVEIRKKVSGNSVGGTSGAVVYEPDSADVQAQGPSLLDPAPAPAGKQPAAGSTPPPPPPSSFGGASSTQRPGASSGSSSSSSSGGSVPQLF
ncbi:MAG: TrbI/VirB10 family protein [Lactobacillaceae bacterium]|nr:TrbI/VirB10 family protein [Lactobacillaceae bacterium]